METKKNRICPWWLGYTLILPTRKFQHNPDKILGSYLKPGMNVLDYGCAMGYFSIPMALTTGEKGNVYCVDIQQKMLNKLQKRAKKYKVDHIIKPLLLSKSYKPEELHNQIDFALLFAVVHEVPDKEYLFKEIFKMVKPGGKLLFSEPKGHVNLSKFSNSVNIAKNAGFNEVNTLKIRTSHAVLLEKK